MIILGRIVAPFGVKGWLKVQPLGDDQLAWADMAEWWVSRKDDAPDEAWTAHELVDCREHGNVLVAQFADVNDRDAAEAMKGLFVGAPRDALPATGEDEFYWADLTGLAVVNTAGESLGTVAGLISTGAHDVLRVVEGEEAERLIPFVKAYVLDVDMPGRTIRVDWQKDW